MEFLAGIFFAWTVVEVMIAIGSAAAYFLFGRNRAYLIFAVYNGFLALFFFGRVGQTLAVDVRQAALFSRLLLAALALSDTSLFWLAIHDYPLKERARRVFLAATASLAVVLAGLSLAGLSADEKDYSPMYLGLLSKDIPIVWFPMTVWGYAEAIVCLIFVSLAAAILIIKAKEDRLARSFFIFGIVALAALTLHDLTVAAGLIKSAFLAEHGMFVMSLCVLMSFLREYELSRRRVEEKTAALRSTAERLDRATDETRKLRTMADVGRLSASLAHEIRNPLAVLNNVASTLLRHGAAQVGSEGYQSLVKILQEETDRLARLVDDLLLYASAGRLSRTQVDAASVVEIAGRDATRQLPPDSNLEIATEVQEGLPPFSGNLDNLRRALLNLIINAVQSSRAGGKIEVFARFSPGSRDEILIGVKDHAGGVPEEEVPHIFEPFYSTRATGTGLGLPIARSIAESHRGRLLLENHPGIGAEFWISIPIGPVAAPEEQDGSTSQPR